MNNSIFNLLDEVEAIADAMTFEAEETGDISEEMKAQLDALELEKDEKAEQLALIYKQRKYLAEAKKAEAKKLSEDAARIEKANARLLDYIVFLLEGKKLETARVKVTYRKAPKSVAILDESKIPAQFWKPGKPSISKSDIKDAIKAGEVVPGAVLVSDKKNAYIN